MEPDVDRYLIAIGKVAAVFGQLEEVAISWVLMLCETPDPRRLHVKLLRRGLANNLANLRRRIRQRLSERRRDAAVALVDKADEFREERNKIVHAGWYSMVDARTGSFSQFRRFRNSAEKGAASPDWDVSTPSVEEINEIARTIGTCITELNNILRDAWDNDEKVMDWRWQHRPCELSANGYGSKVGSTTAG
jgi:hypothetical protein